jgi:uncharacterized protein YecE (DUF72 family)
MSPLYFIGTSGWHYNHWRGIFYPENLPTKDWLNYYSRQFTTVEINNSFYRLPQETTFSNWRESVSLDFSFSVKTSRFITHIKRLKDSQEPMNTFILRASHLKNKLGPILYQLPSNFHRDDARLESFFEILDHKHQHVVEFRHVSWMDEEIYGLLRKYNVAFCIFDMPGFTSPLTITADFAYLRFHGRSNLYSSLYSDNELADWANKIRSFSSNLNQVFVYFNNDSAGFAVENALKLRKLLEES